MGEKGKQVFEMESSIIKNGVGANLYLKQSILELLGVSELPSKVTLNVDISKNEITFSLKGNK